MHFFWNMNPAHSIWASFILSQQWAQLTIGYNTNHRSTAIPPCMWPNKKYPNFLWIIEMRQTLAWHLKKLSIWICFLTNCLTYYSCRFAFDVTTYTHTFFRPSDFHEMENLCHAWPWLIALHPALHSENLICVRHRAALLQCHFPFKQLCEQRRPIILLSVETSWSVCSGRWDVSC